MNVCSIRGEYAWPSGMRMGERPLNWVATAGFGGFFGANRDALGFTSVAELGSGDELPLEPGTRNPDRLRLAAAYLWGPDVHGWTIGLSLQY